MKQNCWEVKRCGREPGGHRTASHGLCLCATAAHLDGANGGRNGGRICWQVRANSPGLPGAPDCQDATGCLDCGFIYRVVQEAGTGFSFFAPGAGS